MDIINPGVNMNYGDRDFFIYRIICGKIYHNDIYIKDPSPEILYNSCIVYKDLYEKSQIEGIYENMLDILIDADLWSIDEEEQLLKILPEEISDVKVELFDANPLTYLRCKSKLVDLQNRLKELYRRRHNFDQYTCGGIAELAKLKYIVEYSTYKNDERVNWKDVSLDKMVGVYGKKYIDESTVRFLCRNDPWQDIWSAARKNNTFLFAQNGIDLSDEQRKLILWSSLYDNIKEFSDVPDKEVIDDDDRLDGWLIKKNRETEIKKKQKDIQISKNPRINNANEIFVFVKNVEEARAVDSMNTFQANLVKQSRMDKIKREGAVDKQKFADVKQDLKIAINRKILANG